MKTTVIVALKNLAPYQKTIQRIARRASSFLKIKKASVEIYLVTDAFMHKNILAFPAPAHFPRPDLRGCRDLGELYLNPVYMKKSGEDIAYFCIHGLLHLLGYDHRGKRDTMAMEEKEKELLRYVKT